MSACAIKHVTFNEPTEKYCRLLVSLVKLRGADAIVQKEKKRQICCGSNFFTQPVNDQSQSLYKDPSGTESRWLYETFSIGPTRLQTLFWVEAQALPYRVDPLGSPPYWAIHRENPTRLPQWPPSDTKGVNGVKVKIYLHNYSSYFGSRHSDA
jgi:hypothetical protein